MGLIKEPTNIDFTVLDKPWSDRDRKDLSEFIKQRKINQKKTVLRGKKIKTSN
jgi:hypothetical protein